MQAPRSGLNLIRCPSQSGGNCNIISIAEASVLEGRMPLAEGREL